MEKLSAGWIATGLSLMLVACSPQERTGNDGGNTSFAVAGAGGNTVSVADPVTVSVKKLSEWNSSPFRCSPRSIAWSDVNDWHYQLQKSDYEELADSKYDLLVIDSEPRERPNRNAIERLKCNDGNEKLVVSYLSIGQAESYRYYYGDDWEVGSPDWIVYPDPFWKGDFYVRYWDPEWRAILMGSPDSRVDRIVQAGFDGIYLDVVDAYTVFEADYPNAIDEMQKLIKDVSDYARAKSGNPDFGVFVQNAEELIAVVGPEWVEPLTGISKEEPFYWATDDRVADESRYWNNLYLQQWLAAGKLVLNVDYVTTEAHRQDAIADSLEQGYVPLMLSSKELDRMDKFPDHQPD